MKKEVLKIMIVFCNILIIFFLLFCPNIYLNSKSDTIEVNSQYKDSGYKSRNLLLDTTSKVTEENNVDTKKVGDYEVEYTVKYSIFKVKRTKKVHVVDKENPVITLKGSEEAIVCPGKEYIEEGYSVTDNSNKNLEKKVKIFNNKDSILYYVKDSSGNEAKKERKIKYSDTELPTITLAGYQDMTLYVGNAYYESGYSATDNCDGDITANVTINNPVDIYTPGVYTITYTITDSAGNSNSINRTVRIARYQSYGSDGVIYLTFDDGPSSTITGAILDILREQNVKATFFVTSKSSSLDYLIRREYDEGHTVALHTSSHNYSYIYASSDNYFADLYAIRERVARITGQYSNILRFPGGSSNTVSRNYSTGIMSYLTQEVESRGFVYFDWNVDCNDAGGAASSNEVYNNVIYNISHSKTNVVLMHDFENNYKTLNALRDIITFGKNNGYSFSNITEDTPRVHHGVNN